MVLLAYHNLTKEKVTIKVLEKTKFPQKEDVERLYREISYYKKLKHRNIIKIYEVIIKRIRL